MANTRIFVTIMVSDGGDPSVWLGRTEAERREKVFDYIRQCLDDSGDSDEYTKSMRESMDAGNFYEACDLFASWWAVRLTHTEEEFSDG